MRLINEMKRDIRNLIYECPGITQNEIVKQLQISQRFLTKLLDDMIKNGEVCLKN